jgi:hypothetical protein
VYTNLIIGEYLDEFLQLEAAITLVTRAIEETEVECPMHLGKEVEIKG